MSELSAIYYHNLIPRKDECAYYLAATLVAAGWSVQTVQSYGLCTTRKGSVATFFPLFWQQHMLSVNGGATGYIYFPDAASYAAFTSVPPGFEKKLLSGGYDAMQARSQIIEDIAALGGLALKWMPGNNVGVVRDDATFFITLMEYDVPNNDEFFQIETPPLSVVDQLVIGGGLQTEWAVPQGGGYILTSPDFEVGGNALDLFFCVGGADVFDTVQTMRWMAGTPGSIPKDAFYRFQATNTTPLRPMIFDKANFVVYASPTNFWAAALQVYAGQQTNIYASILKPPGTEQFSYFAFDCAPPVGFRTALYSGNNRGIYKFGTELSFEPFGVYIPYMRNPNVSEVARNWGGFYTQCNEAFALVQRFDGSMFNAGLFNNIILTMRQFDIDVELPFDLAIYRPFTIGNPTSVLVEERED